MAKIKLSGIISDISGKVGGSIFQKSQSGYTLRNLSFPVNKKTPSQENIRNITNRLQQYWLILSQKQRDIWHSFARYNVIKQNNFSRLLLNGHQTFLKLNHYRLLYGYPVLTIPQFLKCQFTSINLTLELRNNRLVTISDRELIPSTEFLIIFLTFYKNKSINNPGSSYRAIIGDFSELFQNDITDEYFNVFSYTPVPGQTLFFKFTNASKLSGMIKPFFSKKVTL